MAGTYRRFSRFLKLTWLARAKPFSSREPPPDIYKPLDKDTREIRLFKILPSDDANATVEIQLFRRRLEDVSGQFIPFTYVWGDAKDTKPIKVNGISTPVTRNLADFLKQTRALLPDILIKGSWDKPAIFWADAICINQKDPEERSHQVQLMKSIYSSAPLALAWLGHTKDAHLAVDLAESLGPPHGLDFLSNLPNVDYSSWMLAHPHLWAVSEGRNAYWEACKALVRLPYWTPLCFLVNVLAWAVDSERPDWHSVAVTYLPQLGIPFDHDFSRAWKEDIFKGYSPEGHMWDWENAAAAMAWTWEHAKKDVETMRTLTNMQLRFPLKFATNNGYIGTVIAAQAGDLVVVLAGCKAPVLLRRKGSHYEHVGPCLVMGLMEGEAKQMLDRGEAKIETFEIR
ncbi:hypothetical protein CEP51_006571 [Fusarium floridanum]|uniref:Heterokaryon incompatibility domain-containing protein n=1 Tax=Fusarium floridanum TaxID=1325733 RepID=A0A428RSB5_9HYPO|nr:hypothetical protein CEP51_006571 [Fusarium floridanum]